MTEEQETERKIEIPFKKLYAFSPEDVEINIESSFYSNVAYINVNHRDVIIDFLETPGVKSDGKHKIFGKRILMTHTAAKKLADVIINTLSQAEKSEDFEIYGKISDKTKEKKQD